MTLESKFNNPQQFLVDRNGGEMPSLSYLPAKVALEVVKTMDENNIDQISTLKRFLHKQSDMYINELSDLNKIYDMPQHEKDKVLFDKFKDFMKVHDMITELNLCDKKMELAQGINKEKNPRERVIERFGKEVSYIQYISNKTAKMLDDLCNEGIVNTFSDLSRKYEELHDKYKGQEKDISTYMKIVSIKSELIACQSYEMKLKRENERKMKEMALSPKKNRDIGLER